jgi:membrane protein YqaA with SNARE-associated domain
MLLDILQAARRPRSPVFAAFRHWGAFGLFFLAILDSLPVPTFGGPDILTVILVVTRRNPWYEYAATATVGSALGAYIVFKMAHQAGRAYLDSKFGPPKIVTFLNIFERWGTGALVASTAIPFPSPTSIFLLPRGHPITTAHESLSFWLGYLGLFVIQPWPSLPTFTADTSFEFSGIPRSTGDGC